MITQEKAEQILEKEPLTIEECIRGLEIILCESGDKGKTIHRDYVCEKLRRIRNGTMGFHPLVKKALVVERKL